MMVALNDIEAVQAKPTQNSLNNYNWLMDYAVTHPNANLQYFASDMILYVYSDTAYLVQNNAHIQIVGFDILSTYSQPTSTIL